MNKGIDFTCIYTVWENYVYITQNLEYTNAPETQYSSKTRGYCTGYWITITAQPDRLSGAPLVNCKYCSSFMTDINPLPGTHRKT